MSATGVPGPGALPPGGLGELERIRNTVSVYFPIYDTRIQPQSVVFLVHADPASLGPRFDRLRQEMWPMFYVPILRQQTGEYIIEVVRRPPRGPSRPWINYLLLVLTAASTTAAGAIIWLSYTGGTTLTPTDFLYGALTFALPLMVILGVHEFAHFVLARRHNVEASLPYFIPVPPPFLIFGTFGAFISLRQPIPDKKSLIDIGAAGPLAGFAIAVPVAIGGLLLSVHSPVLPPYACGPTIFGVNYGNLTYGVSALWAFFGLFIPLSLINLHPLALAGWVGLLVTAINLLPAGQLDGGHVFRALLGDRSRYLSYAAMGVLFILGFFYVGWFLFALLVFLLGVRHPPPLNDLTPLDTRRLIVGAVAAGVLLSGFVIIPLAPPSGAFGLSPSPTSNAPLPPGYAMAGNASFTVDNHDIVGHSFLFSGRVVQVVGNYNNQNQSLPPPQLAAFANNSTWVLHFANGELWTLAGAATFTVPEANYTEVDAGASVPFNVTYLNPQQAFVTFDIVVTELCAGPSGGAQTIEFTVS